MNEEKTLAFVLMLDTSGSMYWDMDMVKIDAKAFVRQARKGDQFAINHFSNNASWVYPTGNSPQLLTVSSDLHETKDSLKYIEALQSGGVTAMGEAIKLGNQIMGNSHLTTDLKAYVILSDGMHNEGINPQDVLGAEPPVYIAALGQVYKPYFDKLIAKNTKSKFYNQPNAYQMMLMFNQIIADSNDNELIMNDLDEYQEGADYVLKRFQVSSDDNSAQVNVVWSDKKYEYTSGTPGGNGINIVLIDPDDKNTDIKPDIAEDGYCIYNLENVKPGEWKVLIQYSVPEKITGTIGGVDFYTDIRTNMILPASIKADESLDIRVSALNGKDVLEDAKVTAKIARPVMSVDYIMDRYGEDIDGFMRDNDENTEMDISDAMKKLHAQILKTEHKDIFEKEVRTHELVLSKDGEYVLELDEVNNTGICNVDIKVEGINPKTGLPFTRLKSGAVCVK